MINSNYYILDSADGVPTPHQRTCELQVYPCLACSRGLIVCCRRFLCPRCQLCVPQAW